MLEMRRGILCFDVRHGMRPALVANQKAVALREVARIGRLAMGRDLTAIDVFREACRNTLGNDAARRVLAEWIILVPESTCW